MAAARTTFTSPERLKTMKNGDLPITNGHLNGILIIISMGISGSQNGGTLVPYKAGHILGVYHGISPEI